MIIYKITNRINGKIYIGQTVQSLNNRWLDHKSNSRNRCGKYKCALYNAMKKYGLENFTIEQIDTAQNLAELNTMEQTYIKALNSLSPNGYNLDLGGDNKHTHIEVRAKISATLKGRPFKNRYTGGNRKPRTPEQKAHLSAMIKGKPNVVLYKRVVCSNGMIFESQMAAAKHFGVVRQTIASLIKSGTKGRIGHAFKFE